MILQALDKYYSRLLENTEVGICPSGFSMEKISAVAVINENGNLLQVKDIRGGEGGKKYPVSMMVPQSFRRSGPKPYEKPFFLWDNTGFVFGSDDKDDGNSLLKFENFKKMHIDLLKDLQDTQATALRLFLYKWTPVDMSRFENWDELVGCNVVFQLEGERCYLHENELLKQIWIDKSDGGGVNYIEAPCSVTGKLSKVPHTHPPIKGVKGAQRSGASIVSFNADAYESYGKIQNYNAPISKGVVFSYTTTLNYLLSGVSGQKIHIGDATTVYWTEQESPMEKIFGMSIDVSDNELADNEQLKHFLESVRSGENLSPEINPDVKFYILGLSPNESRLSIRFWHVSDVGEISRKIGQHFQDLKIIKSGDNDPEFPGVWRILNETKNTKSKCDAPPTLGGALVNSILSGSVYPQVLLNVIINRIRADQSINYIRAAVIKAILVRKSRIFNNNNLEVSMSLDTENKNVAYLLGRLFATLEKTQKDALPGINSTIKDRYYSSASASPTSVFPLLLRLSQHHIEKDEYGYINDKRIQEIINDITQFPSHLSLDEQGLFAIGYYHQRQSFYQKKNI
ncbi:MAG: type I-C CRISPR-associated protein Cas8c/Csd1 [Novosphingobium sp.]|nr:type I-C CRISPR-associated protein Cas8c/Csd1 [Novosphingobium sp.]